MIKPHKIKKLPVLTTQGAAGALVRESQFVFNYLTDQRDCEIALTMPLRAQSYTASIIPGVLRQNLPEGFLLDWIKERFGKVTKLDDMTILGISGRNTIGRVHCLEDQIHTSDASTESLKNILTWKGTESLFEELSERFATLSGISGVQPKVLVTAKNDADVVDKVSMKDRRFIIKSSGDDYPGLAENEYICMSIARNAKLDVPNFWLSDDRKLFVIERFDIKDDRYLGFEDMTSLMNRQNHEKYNGSYDQIATAIKAFVTPEFRRSSLESLFSIVALSVLLRNGDAHLKNFGLLYTHPQFPDVRLSPIYDIVTTTSYLPKDVMALKLNKSKSWPSKQSLIEFGKRQCEIDSPGEITERIAEVACTYRPDEKSEIWARMKPIIDHACFEFSTRSG